MSKPFRSGSGMPPDEKKHVHSNVFSAVETKGPARLEIAPADDQISPDDSACKSLPEPFCILYVLLVPRATGKAGRFQSPVPLDRVTMESFLAELMTKRNVCFATGTGKPFRFSRGMIVK